MRQWKIFFIVDSAATELGPAAALSQQAATAAESPSTVIKLIAISSAEFRRFSNRNWQTAD